MDLEWVGGPPGDGVPNDLKQMFESARVIDVDICDAVATIHEKRQQKVSVAILRLETTCRRVARRRVMQRTIHSVEQSSVHAVLGFLSQFLGHAGKEAIAANLQ